MASELHEFNKEINTTAKEPVISWFRWTVGSSGAVGTIKQAKANFVVSVTHTSTGLYTVQLSRPYPVNAIYVNPRVNKTGPTDANRTVFYTAGSYSASAGTFTIGVSADTAANNTAQVAADPVTSTEIHVEFVNQLHQGLAD